MNIKLFPIKKGRRKIIELQQHNYKMGDDLEIHYFAHYKDSIGEIEYIKTRCVAIWKIKYKSFSLIEKIKYFLFKKKQWVKH